MNNSAKAASVDDNQIFRRKSDFGHQMRRTRSDFLGTFVSIDKSAPSGADGCEDIVHGTNLRDSIKRKTVKEKPCLFTLQVRANKKAQNQKIRISKRRFRPFVNLLSHNLN